MSRSYIVAVDQSTSATKAFLFDEKALVRGTVSLEHRQIHPRQGWVEHDPVEILNNTVQSVSRLLSAEAVAAKDIAAFALTNQRETVVAWNLDSGEPVYNALVWQDERGLPYCTELTAAGAGDRIRDISGLFIDPYFSASKLRWFIDNVAEARRLAQKGRLACGTVDSWLLYKLTGGKVFASDVSNASRTMLFDIGTLSWSAELIKLWRLEDMRLPEVQASDARFGETDIDGLPRGIPIAAAIGDSHAALFGQAAFEPGSAKVTYGTGSSVMMNIGPRPAGTPNGIVLSVAWQNRDGVRYAYEGNVHNAGDTVRWARDQLGLFSSYREAEDIALSLADNGGVYVVPAFSGLGAPHWVHGVRGMITGLGHTSSRAHIVRAVQESMALQVRDLFEALNPAGTLRDIRVDGGPTRNRFLMQFQSDMLGCPIHVASTEAVSARGAAFLAGLSTGLWRDGDMLSEFARSDEVYLPHMGDSERAGIVDAWHRAVRQVLAGRDGRV